MGDFEADIAKSFFAKEKLSETLNEIHTDVVRNLYKNYTNSLLDVKKLKVP